MMSKLPFLALLLVLLSGCAGGPLALSSGNIVPGGSVAPVDAPRLRVAVLDFEDARSQIITNRPLSHVPILELLLAFSTHSDSHPERKLSPVLVDGLEHVLAHSLAVLMAENNPGLQVDHLPNTAPGDVPPLYDFVVVGRLDSAQTHFADPDYGLNFFSVVDLSILPKALGLPTRRISGELMGEATVLERWSGRRVGGNRFDWKSGTFRDSLYGSRPGALQRYYQAMARDAMEPTSQVLGGHLQEKLP
jgi:hypothetical protein